MTAETSMSGSEESMIYIVEDNDSVRRSLEIMLAKSGYKTVSYSSGEGFLRSDFEASDALSCLLLDVQLPGIHGPEVQQILNERGCPIPIILLSAHAEVSIAVKAIQRGAFEFLEKPIVPNELREVVGNALETDKERRLFEKRKVEFEQRVKDLSERERDVLEATVNGQNPKQIAADFGISAKTVLRHKANMLSKMQIRNDVELTNLVNEFHLVESGSSRN